MDLLTTFLYNAGSFIVIISVIVFIHEYGHYWVAKKCGVKIDAFSIGFGKEIYGWEDKSGTRWKIGILPLGGYVKMFGDEGAASTPDSEKLKTLTPEEEKVAFHTQPLLAKAAIVFAGPLANFLLAIVILSVFFFHYGRGETLPEVGEVLKDSAAFEAGLQAGDIITEFNGSSISRFEEIRGIATINPGIELTITYIRHGKDGLGDREISGVITPKLSETTDIFGNKVEVGLIGIKSGNAVVYEKLSITEAIAASIVETYTMSAHTMTALGQMITGQRSADQLSGILRIADYSGKSVERGLKTVFWFMAVLSINLGLINLFPIPMLDGGHLLFYAVEAANGRPLAEKVQEYAFRVGFALLIMLMVFATFNDLKHFDIF